MATEPKRYAQRGTTVADKTKLKYNPTALRDEPKGKSLSFRSDTSPKTSTGGSGGSNLIPRNKVDMASGNRNIGSQGSSAKNIVPRGTSQPGPVRPETSSSARTMKDVQGSSRTVNKALTGPKSFVGPADLGKSIPRGTSQPGPVGSTASKFGKVLGRAHGVGALLYSKDAGEGSDFKGTNDRPAPYSGLTLTGEDKKQEASKAPTAKAPTAKAAIKSAPKGESQSSKDSRMAAYEDWVKTNRDPATASYLKTGQMKKGGKVKTKCYAKGGSVKSSAASRGDGCATKGHTKGAMR
tara:strand:- start:1624 stop:2508 length:885 start_codon:yes stop_codon:yes gene_type:complete